MLSRYNLNKYLLKGDPKKTFDKLIHYKLLALKGVASTYYDLYIRYAQAISENEGPAFVTIPNKNKKNDETLRYYKDCGRYPSGSPASNCWICNPELAPDN
ncbi:hypothetical protein BT67DRAFT_441503, partial [Trichocladium antarcticum]